VVDKLLSLDPGTPQNWLRKATFLWKMKGDLTAAEEMLNRAIDLDPTPNSLVQKVIFVREVRDDIWEANKLERAVIFNTDYRLQDRWEFFVRNDNEAFTMQHQHFVARALSYAKNLGKVALSLFAGADEEENLASVFAM